jgi:hypothetical protein
MGTDAKVELVARAIEQPFIPHGYELKPHLLKAAARAAIAALEQSDAEQGEALERIKSIAGRKDISAAGKVACIESIAHSALHTSTGR